MDICGNVRDGHDEGILYSLQLAESMYIVEDTEHPAIIGFYPAIGEEVDSIALLTLDRPRPEITYIY